MTVESAKAYIERMRADEPFRQKINATADEAANWEFIRENGFEFTVQEFKQAADLIYQERGITPL